MEIHLRATGYRLPYEITQYYLPPDTSEHTATNDWKFCKPFVVSVTQKTLCQEVAWFWGL